MNNLSKSTPWLAVALLALAATGCDDLIEPDISREQVTLLAPADSTRTTRVVQHFRWQAVSGARKYRIRIGGPSLKNPSAFYLDSLVRHPFYTRALTPGYYTWQVQAVNDSYATPYTSRLLQIDSTGILSGQTLQLLLPGNNSVNRGGATVFSWGALPMAQRYLLELTPTPRGTSSASLDTLVGTSTSVSLLIPARSQVYQWKVRALNAHGLTSSATQRFEVDNTPPPAPTLGSPGSGASFSTLPITLSWTRGADDVKQDSVFLFQANQTSPFSGFPRVSTGMSLVLAGPSLVLPAGTYYWAVRSVDRAGNVGPLSAKRSFLLP